MTHFINVISSLYRFLVYHMFAINKDQVNKFDSICIYPW
jgi:hypothetical protein